MQKDDERHQKVRSAAERLQRLEQDDTPIAVWGDEGGQQADGSTVTRASFTTAGIPHSNPAQQRPPARASLGPMMRTLFPTQHQFDDLVVPWSWCRCCQRAFVKGTYRPHHIAGTARRPGARLVQECPYQDCWGQILRDSRPWASIRYAHPGYPEQPERHVVYAHQSVGRP